MSQHNFRNFFNIFTPTFVLQWFYSFWFIAMLWWEVLDLTYWKLDVHSKCLHYVAGYRQSHWAPSASAGAAQAQIGRRGMKLDAWINRKMPAPAEPGRRLAVPPWTLIFGAPHHLPIILRNCSFQILKARWVLKRYHRCLGALQTVLKDSSNFHSEVLDLPRGVTGTEWQLQKWYGLTAVFTPHSFLANDLNHHPTKKMLLEFPAFDCLWKLFTFLFLYLYLKTHQFHRHPGENT